MTQADRDDLLAAIEEETRRLARFVSNLLDMTRLESGTLDLRRDWVDVADVIRAAVTRAAKAFPSRTVAVRLEPGLALVRGDPVLFEQALFNLLDNADKYSGPGTPTVISARMAGEDVAIAVEDDGCGIAPADLNRIFEKFTRVNQGDGRAPGTGLGLSVTKGVVEAMGGSIRAESPTTEDHGTRLLIRLPAAPAMAEPKELAHAGE